MTNLLGRTERIEQLMKLSPEAILLRWVNHQLEKSGTKRRCTNFNSDITDSVVYSYLLKQIAPYDDGVTMEALQVRFFRNKVHCIAQLTKLFRAGKQFDAFGRDNAPAGRKTWMS